MGGRNGRVAGGDRDLMQVRDDVSYRNKTGHRGLPMLVDDRGTLLSCRSQSQFGPIAQPGQSLCPS